MKYRNIYTKKIVSIVKSEIKNGVLWRILSDGTRIQHVLFVKMYQEIDEP